METNTKTDLDQVREKLIKDLKWEIEYHEDKLKEAKDKLELIEKTTK